MVYNKLVKVTLKDATGKETSSHLKSWRVSILIRRQFGPLMQSCQIGLEDEQ